MLELRARSGVVARLLAVRATSVSLLLIRDGLPFRAENGLLFRRQVFPFAANLSPCINCLGTCPPLIHLQVLALSELCKTFVLTVALKITGGAIISFCLQYDTVVVIARHSDMVACVDQREEQFVAAAALVPSI